MNNGVHASASPLESLAERGNWLQLDAGNDAFGRAVLDVGVSEVQLAQWLQDVHVAGRDGKPTSIFDALEDMDLVTCVQAVAQFFLFEQASSVATRLVTEAEADEPICTMLLQVAAKKHGGELHGLEYCLKGQQSLTRKLIGAIDQIGGLVALRERESKGETLVALSRDQNFVEQDVLRYTVKLPTDTYVTGVRAVSMVLKENNFVEEYMWNFWPFETEHVSYLGINASYKTPAGIQFELQFHTPEALQLKDTVSHELYEAYRIETSETKKRAIFADMLGVWDSVPRPPHVNTLGERKLAQSEKVSRMTATEKSDWAEFAAAAAEAVDERRVAAMTANTSLLNLLQYACTRPGSNVCLPDWVRYQSLPTEQSILSHARAQCRAWANRGVKPALGLH